MLGYGFWKWDCTCKRVGMDFVKNWLNWDVGFGVGSVLANGKEMILWNIGGFGIWVFGKWVGVNCVINGVDCYIMYAGFGNVSAK